MYKYRTILKEACAERIINKSKFIAYAAPVDSKDEADEFFKRIRDMHRLATHNVPAFVIGENCEHQWASDDGEPQGTSGVPIVRMMTNEGITNAAVLVTRYFGGIKLGTGGLMRAYTGSAKLALEAAGICQAYEFVSLSLRLDYAFHSRLLSMADTCGFAVRNESFDDKVSLDILVKENEVSAVRNMLADLTKGQYTELDAKQVLVKKLKYTVDIP